MEGAEEMVDGETSGAVPRVAAWAAVGAAAGAAAGMACRTGAERRLGQANCAQLHPFRPTPAGLESNKLKPRSKPQRFPSSSANTGTSSQGMRAIKHASPFSSVPALKLAGTPHFSPTSASRFRADLPISYMIICFGILANPNMHDEISNKHKMKRNAPKAERFCEFVNLGLYVRPAWQERDAEVLLEL